MSKIRILEQMTVQSDDPHAAPVSHEWARPKMSGIRGPGTPELIAPQQAELLARLPAPDTEVIIPKNGMTVHQVMQDLARLTTETGDGFALLSRAEEYRIFQRGDSEEGVLLSIPQLTTETALTIRAQGWFWEAHTQTPGRFAVFLKHGGED